MLKRLKWRLHAILTYLIGEWYCRRWHRPLLTSLGGWGGRDVWGRRRGAYHGVRFLVCGRTWFKNGEPTPLTPEQRDACAEAFGSMWVGGTSEYRADGQGKGGE